MEQGIWDTLYQVLVSPSQGLRRVTEQRPLGWAVLLGILISLVIALTLLPDLPELVRAIFGLEQGRIGIGFVMPAWVAIFLATLFVSSGILYAAAVLLGGRGSYLGLFCGLSFATLPVIFSPSLSLLRALLGSPGSILYLFGSVALFIWILALVILALRYNYSFSLGKAVATYFIPVVVFIAISLISIAVAIGL
jgi:hypothetical protein